MKKLLICATFAGVTVGVYYLLCKTKKEELHSKPMKEKTDFESKINDESTVEEKDVVQEMYVAKEKSAQSINERHTDATEIMDDAFENIMKDVGPVERDKESVDIVIDTKDVEIVNKLDSLSDELDELLK